MLALDETLFVEHKAGLDRREVHGVAAAVAAFANTAGGWLLLGVKDGKPVMPSPDWASSPALPLVDMIRDRLRSMIDPMPPFEARMVPVGDAHVGVVRVYESADTPHVLIPTGAVYIREVAGGSNASAPRRSGSGARAERAYEALQIRSRAQLVELATRGERAAARLETLLHPGAVPPLVGHGLKLQFEQIPNGLQPSGTIDGALVCVRVAPYTLAPRFRGWVTTADAAAAALTSIEQFADMHGLARDWVQPHPAGLSVEAPRQHTLTDTLGVGIPGTARLVVDGIGLAGAALQIPTLDDDGRRPWMTLDQIESEILAPTIRAAAAPLAHGEFVGRARCQVDMVGLVRAIKIEHTDGVSVAYHVPVTTDVVLPLEDEGLAVVSRLAARALGRSAGLPAWDLPEGLH